MKLTRRFLLLFAALVLMVCAGSSAVRADSNSLLSKEGITISLIEGFKYYPESDAWNLIVRIENDTDSEVYFDEPAFEISVLDNSNYESFYHGVYSENGDTLFEEGEWILADDKSETVLDWIKVCSQAMGNSNGQ